MKAAAIAAILAIAAAEPAFADLSRTQLEAVLAPPPRVARLDLALRARDASGAMRQLGEILDGRTGFISFVDYTCNTLCGTDLALLSQALLEARLSGGYHVIVIGIDPRDSARDALKMEREEIPSALWPNVTLLLPGQSFVQRATGSLGFRFAYDPAIDQFAHPAVVYAVGGDGTLLATLSPLTLTEADLRNALHETPSSPGLLARVQLLCYALGPASGLYTTPVLVLLRIAALITVLSMGAAVWVLIRHRRRFT